MGRLSPKTWPSDPGRYGIPPASPSHRAAAVCQLEGKPAPRWDVPGYRREVVNMRTTSVSLGVGEESRTSARQYAIRGRAQAPLFENVDRQTFEERMPGMDGGFLHRI